jgi:hypothetical protein
MRGRRGIDIAIAGAVVLLAASVVAADGDRPIFETVSFDQIEALSRTLEAPPGVCAFSEEDGLVFFEASMNDRAATEASELELPFLVSPTPPR